MIDYRELGDSLEFREFHLFPILVWSISVAIFENHLFYSNDMDWMVLLPPRKWGDLYYSAEFLEFCIYSYSNRVADSVNVYGLKYTIDNYSDSMRVLTGEILGLRAGSEWHTETKKIDEIQSSVIELYSLLHQRYVLSEDGLETMVCNARILHFLETQDCSPGVWFLSSLFVWELPSSSSMTYGV